MTDNEKKLRETLAGILTSLEEEDGMLASEIRRDILEALKEVSPPPQGHGWVKLRTDGRRARCGGPAICSGCQIEAAELGGWELALVVKDLQEVMKLLTPLTNEHRKVHGAIQLLIRPYKSIEDRALHEAKELNKMPF